MALTAAGMSAAIEAELEAQFGEPEDAMFQKKFADAVAQAVVDYITANAEVDVSVSSVTGVTPGPGASGPGTGSGTIS